METKNNSYVTAQGDIVAERDINVGDSMIAQNVKNMENIFNSNSTTNIYMGLSTQQYEQLRKDILSEVKEILEQRGKENVVFPDRDVFIPAMQTLTNKFEREDIRKMFTKLLANSMDRNKKQKVHPSFIEIIKNMNSLDAILFKKLLKLNVGYIKVINPNIGIKETNKVFIDSLPQWYMNINIEGYNMFDISTSLINLDRLGVIDLMFDRTAGNEGYDALEKSKDLVNVLVKYQNIYDDKELEIRSTHSIINLTEYGKNLAEICL